MNNASPASDAEATPADLAIAIGTIVERARLGATVLVVVGDDHARIAAGLYRSGEVDAFVVVDSCAAGLTVATYADGEIEARLAAALDPLVGLLGARELKGARA